MKWNNHFPTYLHTYFFLTTEWLTVTVLKAVRKSNTGKYMKYNTWNETWFASFRARLVAPVATSWRHRWPLGRRSNADSQRRRWSWYEFSRRQQRPITLCSETMCHCTSLPNWIRHWQLIGPFGRHCKWSYTVTRIHAICTTRKLCYSYEKFPFIFTNFCVTVKVKNKMGCVSINLPPYHTLLTCKVTTFYFRFDVGPKMRPNKNATNKNLFSQSDPFLKSQQGAFYNLFEFRVFKAKFGFLEMPNLMGFGVSRVLNFWNEHWYTNCPYQANTQTRANL